MEESEGGRCEISNAFDIDYCCSYDTSCAKEIVRLFNKSNPFQSKNRDWL